ncbi:MAG: RNA pyrophosphohydrolase [Pseudomonadota bacterium]
MTPDEIEKLPYRRNVGVMLVNADGRVFVGQRRDNPGPAWQMPQGGIDEGENPREAALRELEEETGISPSLVEIIGETSRWVRYELPLELVRKLWNGRWRGQEQKYFLMRFLGRDEDVNINTADPEFSAWTWIDAQDLPGAIVPFKRGVYEAVLEEFTPLLRGM